MPIRYSVAEVMEMAVQTEQGGKLFYETVAAQCHDKKLADLFHFLAGEEGRHIATFEEIARAVKTPPEERPYDWNEVSLYLKAITDSRYFLGKDKALTLARACTTTDVAVQSALAFEKETLLFYLEAADMVYGTNRNAVDRLIIEERAHIRKLTAFAAGLPS
jgi:rubrerythrin